MHTKTNMIGDFEDGVRKPTEEKRKKKKQQASTITMFCTNMEIIPVFIES